MRTPFLKGLFDKIGAMVAAAAFAEENEAATARQIFPGRRRSGRTTSKMAAGAHTP